MCVCVCVCVCVCQRNRSGKESSCSTGDQGSTPGLGRSPGEGNGNSLWYSCLRNPMDRGAWWATVHGARESDMTQQLNHHDCVCVCVCVCVYN